MQIALLLLWREGKVLVALRRADAAHLPNVWEFPGGKIRAGETPADAARREALEELGVPVVLTREREVFSYQYPERNITFHPFDGAISTGEPQPISGVQLRWLAPHELNIADFPPANAALIAELEQQI